MAKMDAIIESVELVESIDLSEIAEPVEMVEIGTFKRVTWFKLVN